VVPAAAGRCQEGATRREPARCCCPAGAVLNKMLRRRFVAPKRRTSVAVVASDMEMRDFLSLSLSVCVCGYRTLNLGGSGSLFSLSPPCTGIHSSSVLLVIVICDRSRHGRSFAEDAKARLRNTYVVSV